MSAVQFFLPYQTATYNGIAQPGAKLYFYTTGTTTPLAIYSNSGLSIARANPVIANGAGQFPAFYLDNTKTYRLVIKDKNDVSLGVDIDPYIPGTIPDASVLQPYDDAAAASAAASAASETNAATSATNALAALNSIAVINNATAHAENRTVLATLNTALGPAYLAESGRSGTFVWSSANFVTLLGASLATSDPNQGIYVAPASDPTGASGAWVRQFDGPILQGWVGVVADDDSNAGTDNSAALAALVALVQARSKTVTGWTGIYRGGDEILCVGRVYAGAFTFEPLSTIKLRGIGGLGVAAPSRWRFAAGVTALRAQSYNTSGTSTVDGSNHYSGDNWTVENMYFLGPWAASTTTEGEYYGLHVKRPIQVTNCTFDGFQGDALVIDSTTGLPDMCRFTNCHFLNSRNGVVASGNDSNACIFFGCHFNYNRAWGVNDTAFLGNYYYGCHAAANGIQTYSGALGASVVSDGTYRYAVIDNQTAGAVTNGPTSGVDNTWWYFIGPGAAAGTSIPLWVSGMPIRAGGAYRTRNASSNNLISGCYSESGQGPSQFTRPTLISGGAHGAGVHGGSYTYGGSDTFGMAFIGDVWMKQTSGNTFHLNLDGPTQQIINFNNASVNQAYITQGSSRLMYNVNTGLLHDFRVNAVQIAVIDVNGLGLVSGSLGYRTGAGGAVTQAASRTTGVTLNTACGQITLFSAAGSASWQTFTVTNSKVAATDVIRLNQASGTDLYQIMVTNVAAGSFKVSFATTGGTTTEAPVFSFAVVKAVAA